MQQQQPSITAPQTPQTPQAARPPLERELPMLAGIGAFVTWCEDLLAVLSGPILTAGLAIALIDLLSDGQLFTRLPMLLWVWAGSMALGLDAQFIGSSAKLARAMRQRRPWVATGYILLCLALGYVAFLATYVFAVQEANGITTTEALSRLGMDSTTWIFQRSVLAVILVFLSGLLRYVPPAVNVAADTTEERERLLAEIELEPLRAQKRAMQLRGMRGAVLAGLGREQPASPQPMKPHIVAASSTLPPETPPVEHHATDILAAHNAMHDWDDDILDEVEEDDPYGYQTMEIPAVDLADEDILFHPGQDEEPTSASETTEAKKRGRRAVYSGPKGATKTRGDSVREANEKIDKTAKPLRKRLVREMTYAILDEWHVAGRPKGLGDRELARLVGQRVRASGPQMKDFLDPGPNTVARLRGPWQSSRAHKAAKMEREREQTEIEPMEPQELRELVATEAW